MTLHASLTGADLHEPKGADAASVDTVYVSNGAGSGSWVKIDSANIDTTSIPAINRRYFQAVLADVSTASFVLIPIPFNCTIVSLRYVLGGAITVADSIVTVTNSGGSTLGTQTIAFTGSAEGTTFNHTPVNNLTYSGLNYIKVATDGGSTGTQPLFITLTVTMT